MLSELGVQGTRSKYGTLRIRDFEMNTLLHVAARNVSPMSADYILSALKNFGQIPVDTQVSFLSYIL